MSVAKSKLELSSKSEDLNASMKTKSVRDWTGNSAKLKRMSAKRSANFSKNKKPKRRMRERLKRKRRRSKSKLKRLIMEKRRRNLQRS